jgi:RNA polymerase sigma-70 factor (ECF subfamily)
MSVATADRRELSRVSRRDGAVSVEDGFEAIYDALHGRIFGLALRMMGNADDASDVTQEAFISAYENIDKLQPQSTSHGDSAIYLSAWLHRVAKNKCIDTLRKNNRRSGVDWDVFLDTAPAPASTDHPPEVQMLHRERTDEVRQALEQMSKQYRTALTLYWFEELSVREIASTMGRSEPAIKSLLFRARDQFRALYTSNTTFERAA